MGFGRDFGAAMTVGLMATTKHKKAEERLQNRFNDHEQRVRSFNVAVERTVDVFQDLSDAFDDAKDACLSTGGLTVNQNDILEYGWFRPTDVAADGSLDEGREVGTAAVGSLPGLGAFIGGAGSRLDIGGRFWYCRNRNCDWNTVRRGGYGGHRGVVGTPRNCRCSRTRGPCCSGGARRGCLCCNAANSGRNRRSGCRQA